MVARNNLYFNGGDAPAWDTAPTVADPLFYDAVSRDYQIDAASPAVDAGVTTEHGIDYLGVVRPQDAGFDIGAFEVAGLAPPPPDLPDLSGTWTKIKRKSARKVKATLECRNEGEAAGAAFTVQVYFSPVPEVGVDAVLFTAAEVGGLQPGQAAAIKFSGKRPAGFGYIIAVVDSAMVVEESDEDDNDVVGAIP
jgi:hypothetical protein